MLPVFSNSDWDLVDKREQSNFQYKMIKIPYKDQTKITFELGQGKMYNCNILPTQVYPLIANSGMFDKFLVDFNDQLSDDGMDDEGDDDTSKAGPDLSNDPLFNETREMLAVEQVDLYEEMDDSDKENNDEWNKSVAKEFASEFPEKLFQQNKFWYPSVKEILTTSEGPESQSKTSARPIYLLRQHLPFATRKATIVSSRSTSKARFSIMVPHL
jgi:hypothetical protein